MYYEVLTAHIGDPNRQQQDLQLQTATPPVHGPTAHLLFFTKEYSVRTMNHEVDRPGQELIGSSRGEVEVEEENKDRDGDEGKVGGEEEGMLPPPKRPRNQCLDRISALHDSLILHILSFLPMEDVVRTGGGISWRSLKSLTLDYAELSDGALAKILSGCPVLEILKIHTFSSARRMDINSASLKMLVVHYCMIEDDEYAVEISAPNLQVLELGDIRPRAISRGTERFAFSDVNLQSFNNKFSHHEMVLPQHPKPAEGFALSREICFRLKELQFQSIGEEEEEEEEEGEEEGERKGGGGIMMPPTKIPRTQSLDRISALHDSVLLHILSFLPMEDVVGTASLKKLVIEHCVIGDGEDVPKISAPNLQLLALSGNFQQCWFRLVNVSAIVKANLSYYGGCSGDNHDKMRSQLLKLLERLEHVKELHLWDWCIQVLSVDDVRGLPSPISSCKMLTLHTHVTKWDIHGIASVLQSSPYIEKLVVDLSSLYHENPWASRKRTYSPFMHLKTIEIVGFKEVDEETVLPLMQILLLSALVLEKMVIKIGKSGYKQCSKCTSSEEFILLTHKLLSFPRASSRAAILFA
ncbi:hypothetical protein RHMOL_Rhmol13G0227300 [Rhododendron molle]|uniref:Uncharacterized protein n=1 Tax=Rhododendron molle TaxID=49168 RepID=A0ACC0LA12_RHOML|nr:hypothetical protein RHMOL_Rhmol13G0227300 [Rhododendron molle]